MTKTSASQLQLVSECGRKWWFRYKERLPEIRSESSVDSTRFGTILHGCCDRYLQQLEVFPPDWDVDPESRARCAPADAVLIRLLIGKAIEAGYLERRPGQTIEKEIRLPGPQGVTLIIKMDFCTRDRVEDHKTSKKEKYFKSPKALRKNIQMMLYAKALLHLAALEGAPLDVVTVCHNQYLRDYDNPLVRRREVDVTRQEIEDFWSSTIVPLIEQQIALDLVTNPFDIPDPPPRTCQEFGGCSRMSICSGQEDMLTYRRRVTMLTAPQEPPMANPPPMDPAAFLASRQAALAKAAVNPPPPPVQAVAPATAPTPASAPAIAASVPPPWTNPGCPLCSKLKNPGFTSKGVPCRICFGPSGKNADGYSWETDAAGVIRWWQGQKPVTSIEPTAVVADAGEKKLYSSKDLDDELSKASTLDEMVALANKAPGVLGDGPQLELFLLAVAQRMEALEAAPIEPEPEVAEKPVAFEPPPPPPEPRKVGRPRKNPLPTSAETKKQEEAKQMPGDTDLGSSTEFMLFIGCFPIKGVDQSRVVFAEQLLINCAGYWQTANAFDRRARIRGEVETGDFLKALGGLCIVQRGRDPDVDNLISCLVPHAATVVQGTVQ